MPSALFLEGNSSLNIRNGSAAATQGGRDILQAVFGNVPKEESKLAAAVYKQYGKGKDGFDIVSCQFATHYFFSEQTILQNFIRNISENCVIGGYFIGTCYDGSKIFNHFKERRDKYKIWKNENKYDDDDDDLSLIHI